MKTSLSPISLIKKIKRNIDYWLKKQSFKKDYQSFLNTGITSDEGYQKLIQLYCASNGKFNEQLSNTIIKEQRSNTDKQITFKANTEELSKVDQELKNEGYAILKKKISGDICDQLKDFGVKTPATLRGVEKPVIYDPQNPVSEIYRFATTDILNQEAVQKLIMDPYFIEIARNYLGSEPIFDFPAMWWSTSFSKEASDDAAQLYHFDMDRIKWIKLFIYLTDVDQDLGPHCYISKSHKVNGKPQHLLNRGYVRIPDIDLKPLYPANDFKEIIAEKGTVFLGDTKCWHKGKPLKKGDRLVLELQYSNSLFGINFRPKCSNASKEFEKYMKDHKFYASNIDFI